MKGVFQKQPTAATPAATATGTDGTDIPVNTVLQRSDGAQYTVTADAVINAGSAALSLEAVVPGAAGSVTNGTKLNFVVVIPGVSNVATVTADASGTDVEDIEAFRGRVLFRWQNPPAGGRPADYIGWATEQPGVTRAWCFPLWQGDGTVGVTFVKDNDAVSIIPTGGDLSALHDFLAGTAANNYTDGVAPVMDPSNIIVFAPTPVPFNPTIHLNPSNAATQAAAWANLTDLIKREAIPGGTIFLSHIEEAVETAPGVVDSVITLPSGNLVMSAGQLLVPGAPTWT
jgi:uncharacterized phage protein gp47/JayE